jgi:RepB DNA-primase from phage plasmid
MLAAIEAPFYDIGVLSDLGMLPGLDGISADAVLAKLSLLNYRNARGSHIYIRPSGRTPLHGVRRSQRGFGRNAFDGWFRPRAVVETSVGNFQAWLRHAAVLPKLVGSLGAQLLARRYDADLSAAGWRRFGRLPGFTNCKPKYRKPDGFFFLRSARQPHRSAVSNGCRVSWRNHRTAKRKNKSERCAGTRLPFLAKGEGGLCLWSGSVPRPNTPIDRLRRTSSSALQLSPMAWVTTGSKRALEDDYLSRDSSPSTRAAYIRRSMAEARDGVCGRTSVRLIPFSSFFWVLRTIPVF